MVSLKCHNAGFKLWQIPGVTRWKSKRLDASLGEDKHVRWWPNMRCVTRCQDDHCARWLNAFLSQILEREPKAYIAIDRHIARPFPVWIGAHACKPDPPNQHFVCMDDGARPVSTTKGMAGFPKIQVSRRHKLSQFLTDHHRLWRFAFGLKC